VVIELTAKLIRAWAAVTIVPEQRTCSRRLERWSGRNWRTLPADHLSQAQARL
jgi:hypothetical protein